MAQKAGEYSVDQVYRTFLQVIDPSSNENILRLPEFVIAFRELAKFFNHVNIVFSFVVKDLEDKFTVLDNLIGSNSSVYRTVQSMFDFERDKTEKPGLSALLRLLRALEFTKIFLERAVIAPAGPRSSKQIAWDVYKETLCKRHNKAIQMSIWVATATIPTRESLEKTMKIGETEEGSSENAFAAIDRVYKQIHQLYKNENLLELVPL